MSNSSNSTDNATFSSKDIKKALRTLEPSLGKDAVDLLINDLEVYGLALVNDRYRYSGADIGDAMKKAMGQDAAELVLERLKKVLQPQEKE